ncbi:hypothetical protein GWP57_10770 [Gammaproteobacteria bacterium]|jgi:hypothetical protein|nr:hypothetical protein [Gammaproteobacteria bacterium]
MMRVGRVFAVTVLLVATLPASAAELVREFSGSGNTTTVAFHVESPWIMDWRLDADYDQLVALDITLVEAKTGRHIGRVLHTKNKGNGVKLFYEAGNYQLRISSTLARWRIKIEQLTDEEAQLYVPKRQKKSTF